MESAEQVLQANVSTMQEKLESEILRKIKFTPLSVTQLDGLLCDTYDRMRPEKIDTFNRNALVRICNLVAKEIYDNSHNSPVVEGYGTFVMDMYTNVSDLDLSINFHGSIEDSLPEKINTLERFRKKLDSLERKRIVSGVRQSITAAKVPIIKFTDKETGIECNFSVNNWDGIKKSKIIYAISAIDERFRKLCFLMKSWAKAHYIYSSKDGILNSLSIILFVAFHLQTCNPPILPPFSVLLKDGADLGSVNKIVKTYFNYGKQNKESLAKLFITLLVKLASVESLWDQGICASVYEGSWISKSWNHPYSMRVEDFMDRSQNVALAVGTAKLEIIYRCINNSISYLSQFLNNQIQGIQLMDFLFGTHTVASLGVGGTSNISGNNPSLEYLRYRLSLMLPYLERFSHNAVASFPPSVSYQPPLPVPSSNIGVHNGLREVPSPFPLKPVVCGLVASQSSQGGVRSLNQEAVAPIPWGRSFRQKKRRYQPPSSTGPLPPREKPYQPPRSRGGVLSLNTLKPIVCGLVASQSSQGGVQPLNQETVAPNPWGRSFPQRKRSYRPPSSTGPLPPRENPNQSPCSTGSLPPRENPPFLNRAPTSNRATTSKREAIPPTFLNRATTSKEEAKLS